MNEYANPWAGPLVSVDDDAAREFEARLADSSRLAIRVAYSVVRNQQDAEDVAQEAFVRAYQRFASLRDRDRFRAWLVRVTWRIAIDWQRGARRREVREQVVARRSPPIGDAAADAIASDRSNRLWTAIDALPEKLRIVIVLSAIDGHAVKDVASLLGLPIGTVKSRLFSARRALEARLQCQ